MFSTRNAGAIAAPDDAVLNTPRTAGMTHHQGKGSMGAITLSSGFSTRTIFDQNALFM
jgi:hypothetical protein